MPAFDPRDALGRRIRRDLEQAIGTHDEPEIYAVPAGDPGLTGPGSMSWELHGDMGVVAIASIGALVMEILHPAVMAGVHDQSNYQTQPERRMRNTFGYVVATTFGSTDAATALIGRVRRMHERVNGSLPDGRPYRAMDPELIGWVHTAIPWSIMLAFDAYRRPLTVDEKNRYLAEQAVIGRLGGAGDIPTTVDQLDEYVEHMRPQLMVTEQRLSFLEFATGPRDGPHRVNGLERVQHRLNAVSSMVLMPAWARRLSGLDHSALARRLWFDPTIRFNVNLIRSAYGMPPWRRLAEARVAGTAGADGRGAIVAA
ncbi:MAG: oxygenase MpaB family protein [Acidimicrobiales bacterium]